uniref:protein erg2 homolog n=1 Tax=Styela clava TaxID=7725 RepID=UPI00193A036D|nr:protein erg2 homolog [Styela clava]
MGVLQRAINITFAYLAICFIGSIWLAHKSYEFHLSEVESVAQDWSESPLKTPSVVISESERIKGIRQQFMKKHEQVLTENKFPALQLSTGGIHGLVHLLYGSLSEFLIVYHAPLQTSGSSGRHLITMSITVLQGSVKVVNERTGKYVQYSTNANYTHHNGERTFVELEENTILVVYGRGLVPMNMGYWLCDSLISSADPATAFFVIYYYFQAIYSSLTLKEFFISLYNDLWMLASEGLASLPILLNDMQTYVTSVSGTISNIFKSRSKSIMTDA